MNPNIPSIHSKDHSFDHHKISHKAIYVSKIISSILYFVPSLHSSRKGLCEDNLIVLGHGSDNCVDPGVGRDRLKVEGSSDFKALGKSLSQVLFEDQKLNLCLHSKSMWQPRNSIDVVLCACFG